MVGRRVRTAWTLFNVLLSLILFPIFLMSWHDPCNTGRFLSGRQRQQHLDELNGQGEGGGGGELTAEKIGGGGAEEDNERRRQGEEDEGEDGMMMGRGSRGGVRRGEGEGGGGGEGVLCPPPGSGAFSPVKLRSTALASYQGSGNTWTRHLLTTATGILTGTVYPNETREIPAGEMIDRAYRLLVIKTHMNPKESRHHIPVDRAILVIRNPYEAILSEFNRGGVPDDEKRHVGVRSPKDFQTKWPRYVEFQMQMWLKFNWYWAKDTGPLHVLVYNRLVDNTEQELRNVLHFLNETSLQKPALHCATRHSEGWAHRKKPDWQQKAAVFNSTQTAFMNAAIDRVQRVLQLKTGLKFDDFQRWKR